jgi:thiamine pyrophosphokinase
MKRAIVFANGRMEVPPELVTHIHTSDLIIAADGGTQHCKSLGITPDVIIGDFDSLDSKEVIAYQQAGVETIQFPIRKDETDLELALQYTLKQEVTEVFIIGALGARWDMTVANILLTGHPMFSRLKIRLLDGSQEITLLRGKGQSDFQGRSGDLISLLPIAGDAHGITTQGLEYPLNDETLNFGSSRGVSNVYLQEHARVSVREGLILCILTRNVKGSSKVNQKEVFHEK